MIFPFTFMTGNSNISTPLAIQTDGVLNIAIAPLKYNKKHAISLEVDDGLNDIYNTFLPLFVGGTTEFGHTSTGLYFTDGCGNDIPFKGSTTTWVRSLATADWFAWSDGTHWLNYAQLDELIQNGFSINCHSYYQDPSLISEQLLVDSVQSYIDWCVNRYGFQPLTIVRPGGVTFNDVLWQDTWFGKNAKFYLNGSANDSTRIDNVDYSSIPSIQSQGRYLLESKDETTIKAKFDSLMATSDNYWLRTYGHRVENGSFIDHTALVNSFEYLASTYGKSGLDNVFCGSGNEIVSYLLTRDTFGVSVDGSNTITLDYSNVPDYVLSKEITLIATSDQPITNVSGTKLNSYAIDGNTAIVNLI